MKHTHKRLNGQAGHHDRLWRHLMVWRHDDKAYVDSQTGKKLPVLYAEGIMIGSFARELHQHLPKGFFKDVFPHEREELLLKSLVVMYGAHLQGAL